MKMNRKRLSVCGAIALLTILLAPAAHADQSCDSQGNFRFGTKVRIQARVENSIGGWWQTFVWKESGAKYIGPTYQTVWNLDVKEPGPWTGYFHIWNQKQGIYVRCDVKGDVERKGTGSYKKKAIRFKSWTCYNVKKNSKDILVKGEGALPVKTSCSRNFNPNKQRLTVKVSFSK